VSGVPRARTILVIGLALGLATVGTVVAGVLYLAELFDRMENDR
jgi:hypothetical protein